MTRCHGDRDNTVSLADRWCIQGPPPPPTNLIAFCSLSHNHLVYRPSFTLVSLLITFTISHCQDLLSPYQHNSTFFKRVTAALLGHSNDSAVTSSPAQNRQTDERIRNKGTAIRGNYQTSITYASLTSYTQNRNMGETIKEFAIYVKYSEGMGCIVGFCLSRLLRLCIRYIFYPDEGHLTRLAYIPFLRFFGSYGILDFLESDRFVCENKHL